MSTKEDYKGFFDDAPVALARTDVQTGEFLMANKFLADLLGYESVDQLKATCYSKDLYSPEIRQELIDDLKEFGVVENKDLELHLPDGSITWIRGDFRLTSEGYIECFLTDITELMRLKEKHLGSLQIISQKLDIALKSTHSIYSIKE